MLKKLLNKKAIIINLKAATKTAALKEIAEHLKKHQFISSKTDFYKALIARETLFSTGLSDGIAIPHAQHNTVLKNVILIARSKKGINWKSIDGRKTHFIFSIALNKADSNKQIDTLVNLSKALMNKETKDNLMNAKTKKDFFESLVIPIANKKIIKTKSSTIKNIIAVTACPTGIAHTYMAAEKIEEASKELGYNFKIETQGRKIDNKLSKEDIEKADVIILAIDKAIDGMERFNDKKVIKTSTKNAIKNPIKLINDCLSGEGEIIKVASKDSDVVAGDYSWSEFKNVYKNLMGGVSRMLPFVVVGGILIGLAFLMDSGISGSNLGVTRSVSGWFAGLGKVAFGIFVPILGAYTAYSIVGPEGLLPGMIAGIIASGGGILYSGFAKDGSVITEGWNNLWGQLTPGINQKILSSGSGFLGAMFGGYAAGFSIVLLRKTIFRNVSKHFRGVTDIVALPLFSTIITAVIMFGFQIPLAYLAFGVSEALNFINDKKLTVVLTMLLGAMMAFDMGGPVNKVAYVFATAALGSTATHINYISMAAVMISGMTPPLGIALSNLMFRNNSWSKKDQSSSLSNWLLGSFFITEGAIPFAAKDPKRTIPSLIIGSIVAGAIVGALSIGVNAPHGGIIVAALFKSQLVSSWSTTMQTSMGIVFMFVALIVGSFTTAITLGFWRMIDVKKGKLILN